jgi:hypothetical protein
MPETDSTLPRRPRATDPAAYDDVPAVAPRTPRGYAEDVPEAVMYDGSLRWDGQPTEFVLARPLVHDHRPLKAGEVVSYDVMPHPTLPGVFIGSGDPDTDVSEHVMDLYRLGMFARTRPAGDRTVQQNAVDIERGIHNPSEGPALASLAEMTGEQLVAMLRAHRGLGSPAALLAAERQAARTETTAPSRDWPGAQAPGTRRTAAP